MATEISKRYSPAQKIKTLRLLESNNFNYLKTSRQTNIARVTLKKWERQYGKEVFKGQSPTEEALKEIDVELKNNDINIIRNLYVLRKRALHKVMTIIENESKLDTLINVLKFVSGEIQKFTDLEKQESNSMQDSASFIQIINNQLKSRHEKMENKEKIN